MQRRQVFVGWGDAGTPAIRTPRAVPAPSRFVDLVRERFGCVIRAGELADSSLVARRIGEMSFPCAASPHFLAANRTPATPARALALPWVKL